MGETVFTPLFGGAAAQTEVIDKIGRPIGASDTDNGITITAEAIMGDQYNAVIVYTLTRDDGERFLPEGKGLDETYRGCEPWRWARREFSRSPPPGSLRSKRGRLPCGRHERAYVLRMAANACKDLLKSPWRKRTCGLETVLEVPAPEAGDGSAP